MFQGRIGIKQYWQAVILLVVLSLLFTGVLFAASIPLIAWLTLSATSPADALPILLFAGLLGGVVGVIPSLVSFPFWLGLQIRRFHDFGLTGWAWPALLILGWVASIFFPVFGPIVPDARTFPEISPIGLAVSFLLFVVGIVIVCWPGTKGPNKFGEPIQYYSVWAAIRGKKDAPIDGKKPLSVYVPVVVLLALLIAAGAAVFLMKPTPRNLPASAPQETQASGETVSQPSAPGFIQAQPHDGVSGSGDSISAALAKVQTLARAYYVENRTYGTSEDPTSDCFSRNTVFGAGESGEAVMDVMRLTGGGVCKTNGSTYVMSVPTLGGAYQCIDSAGTSCKIQEFARGTTCGSCLPD